MSVTRHTSSGPARRLGDEWLVAMASGTLSRGGEVFARTCLAFVPDAQKDMALAETLGGALLDNAPQTALHADKRRDLLAALDTVEMESAAPSTGTTATGAPDKGAATAQDDEDAADTMPRILRDFAGADIDTLHWSFLGPGMKKVRLWQSAEGQTLWMLRARPGARIPEHSHEGTELTLVLKGSFSDLSGLYRRGDVEETDDSHTHDLIIGDEGECICLALTDRPLKFKGMIARMLQPFIGL